MQSPKNAAAGFGTRWVAYIIDNLLAGLASGIVGLPMVIGSLFSENSIWDTRVLFNFTLYAVVMYLVRAVYFVIFTYAFQKTPGKMFLRIQVETKDGEKLTFLNVLFRETIGRFLSGFFLNVGYLFALAGKEHLTWHDMLCDTRVCYSNLGEIEKKSMNDMGSPQPLPHIFVERPMGENNNREAPTVENSFYGNVKNTGVTDSQVWALPTEGKKLDLKEIPENQIQSSTMDEEESD